MCVNSPGPTGHPGTPGPTGSRRSGMAYEQHVTFIDKVSSARAALSTARGVAVESNIPEVADALAQAEDRIGHAINVLRDHEERRWRGWLEDVESQDAPIRQSPLGGW